MRRQGSPTWLPASAWASVAIAALAIDGGKSLPWMQNGSRALAAALCGAQYRTLEGQAHDGSAKVLAPALSEFFRSRARVAVA